MSLRSLDACSLVLFVATASESVAAQSAPKFGPPQSYDVGFEPLSLAVTDLSGDGNLDLAVAVLNSNAVAVLPGQGGGVLGGATNYTVMDASAVAAGDFSGDGKPDLAVARLHGAVPKVSVLLGQAGGLFGAPTNFGVGKQPISIAVGDLSGDGVLDLTVANSAESTVSVLLGTGGGLFGPKTDYTVGSHPYSVAMGDVSGDGTLDVVVANRDSDNVSVLLGQGSGNLAGATNYGVGAGPRSVAVSDLNGDGQLDLAVANTGSNTVSVLMGQGGGVFAAATSYAVGQGPYSVAVGDLNGDGTLDLAVAIPGSGVVSVLPGSAGGVFGAPTNVPAGGSPYFVSMGDLSGDGLLDLAVANTNSGTVAVLLNQGPVVDPWTDFGFGLAGTSGIPDLAANGSLFKGSPTTMMLTNAKPNALANLFMSLTSMRSPFKGGTLIPVPVALTVNLITDPAGAIHLAWPTWPWGVPPGTELFFQYAIQDSAAIKGVALSNALKAVTP